MRELKSALVIALKTAIAQKQVIEALSIAGRLMLHGDDPLPLMEDFPSRQETVNAMNDFDMNLEDAIGFILERGHSQELDDQYQTMQALNDRTFVETVLLGVESVLGEPWTLTEQQLVCLPSFDGTLEAVLWKLLHLNKFRKHEILLVDKQYHDRLWWYTTGLEFPVNTLEIIGLTASVCGTFPEAKEYLNNRINESTVHPVNGDMSKSFTE